MQSIGHSLTQRIVSLFDHLFQHIYHHMETNTSDTSSVLSEENGSTEVTQRQSNRGAKRRHNGVTSVGRKRRNTSPDNECNHSLADNTTDSGSNDSSNESRLSMTLSMPVLDVGSHVTIGSLNESNEQTDQLNDTNESQTSGDMIIANESNVCIDLTEEDSVVDENNVDSDSEVQCISSVIRDQDLCIIRDNRRQNRRNNRTDSSRSPVKPKQPNDDIIEIKDSQPIQSPTQTQTSSPSLSPSKRSVRKSIKCPVCLDESTVFEVSGRQLVSTVCGHLFCDRCISEVIRTSKACPSCRKKIASKRAFHPIFI